MDEQLTSICTTCEGNIYFVEFDDSTDELDGWWSHHHYPLDAHDAQPEATAAMLALREVTK